MIDYKDITEKYYANWLDIGSRTMNQKGLFLNCSSERDRCQVGYSQKFDLYIYIKDELCIVSYNHRSQNLVNELESEFYEGITTQDLKNYLGQYNDYSISHNVKFYFDGLKINTKNSGVQKLTKTDYNEYLAFFSKQYPKANPDSWLREYFDELCEKEYIYGLIKERKIVSVSDAPDMPYMKDIVQEIGINTLEDYRGNGYGKIVAGSMIEFLVEKNICPLWSCDSKNIISEKLAYDLGFSKLADVLTVSL